MRKMEIFNRTNQDYINNFLSSLSTVSTNENYITPKVKRKTLEDLMEEVECLTIYLAREESSLEDEYSLMSRFNTIGGVALHCKFLNATRHKLNYKRTLIENR